MTLNDFVVFLGEAQPQKSRLSERGTSEFRDFGEASLRKTRNYSLERKNKTNYQPYNINTLNSYDSIELVACNKKIKKILAFLEFHTIISDSVQAGVAQLAEQLICNQQVAGSSPIASSSTVEGFPSGQRGQTVNLLATPSEVRILPPPPLCIQ